MQYNGRIYFKLYSYTDGNWMGIKMCIRDRIKTVPHIPGSSAARKQFVFRIGDDEKPTFKLVEAEGGIWRNEAIQNIKDYLATLLADMPKGIQDMITIIG